MSQATDADKAAGAAKAPAAGKAAPDAVAQDLQQQVADVNRQIHELTQQLGKLESKHVRLQCLWQAQKRLTCPHEHTDRVNDPDAVTTGWCGGAWKDVCCNCAMIVRDGVYPVRQDSCW
jgi:hypothetical protein